ncbi:MAG: AAA family ATPase [Caldilineaceae bacterium]|nr:AAA family ATPase [Caldilineaceae bacterium]
MLEIPTYSEDPLRLSLNPGDRLYVVGANGSGKSALIQHLVSTNRNKKIRRISAHRRTWLQSGSLDITPQARRQFDESATRQEVREESRWSDRYAQERQSAVLFDLIALENERARHITSLVDSHETEKAEKASSTKASPFDQLNDLLSLGNLAIKLQHSKGEEILARHQMAEDSFSIAQMSDGERNAAIIAATILTVEPGTVLLIDEPERHLHRAIIEPFLSALFQLRNDCAYLISTHEIALPVADNEAHSLIVRSCTWNGNKASAWDLEFLEANEGLPDDLKRAILGSRKRILFVEGTESKSLDLPIYSALFPDIFIVPKGSHSDVQKAVAGLRSSQDHHRVEAFGLIDRDNCSDDDVMRLAKGFVFALEVYSVESLYYCSEAIAAIAKWQSDSLAQDADEMFESAIEAALDTLRGDDLAARMAARRTERMVRNRIWNSLPTWKDLKGKTQFDFQMKIDTAYSDELARFETLLSSGELDELVARFPLRESGAFPAICRSLELSMHIYRQMLIARVRESEPLAQKLRKRVGPLSSVLVM